MEEAIPIIYFPATKAPDVSEEQENTPDWVSCLAFHPTTLVSGCYDGTVHVYQQDGETLTKLHTIAAASGPIKALETHRSNDGTLYIASASMDQSLWIHSFSLDRGLESEYQCLQDDTSSAISSLDFNKSADKALLASGDGDGGIRLWDMNMAVTVESKKKQKTATGSKGLGRQVKALSTIESAHSQLISGVSWGNHSNSNTTNLVTGGWDHSIKLWDMEKQDCLLTLTSTDQEWCLVWTPRTTQKVLSRRGIQIARFDCGMSECRRPVKSSRTRPFGRLTGPGSRA